MVGCVLLGGVFLRAYAQASGDAKVPEFEVASLRLSPPVDPAKGFSTGSKISGERFTASNMPLQALIQVAFGVEADEIEGGPDWYRDTFYDISAKAEDGTALTMEKARPMLQRLLEQRLHLAAHRETKEFRGYGLTVAKGGLKLQPSTGPTGGFYILRDGMRGKAMSMQTFAAMLRSPTHSHVVDKTGLTDKYDIDLKYGAENDPNSELPSVFTAVQEQMGLKLEPEKISVSVIVIDHMEKEPVEN